MIRTALLAAAAVGALALLGVGPAQANGVPQLVKLTYLDGISDFGPRNAEGVLEFSFAEAYARVDVKNLAPQDGFAWEGWMTAPGGKTFRVGEIPVNTAGIGALETKLKGLDSYDYDLFLIAARPKDAPTATMPSKKSIAGRFAVIRDPGTGASGDTRPSTLPNTGEAGRGNAALRGGITLGAMAATGAGLWAVARARRKDAAR